MNLLIIAGEVSGDLYASYLAKAIKQVSPNHVIYAIGGSKLKSVADFFIFESASQHGISFSKQFLNFKLKRSLTDALQHTLDNHNIDRAILVDFQHFNTLISTCLQSYSIPIYTFITPNFWMWQSTRLAKKICQYSEKIICIFRPEYDFYKSLHHETYYFGHPLSEIINIPASPPIFDTTNPIITLLPGSRPQEFSLYLNAMLQTCDSLLTHYPTLTLLLPVSNKHYKPIIQSYLNHYQHLPITLLSESSHDAIQKSTLVISGSGSATLEVILLDRPLIVLAALPAFTYWIAKYILQLKLSYISLPNFLTNQSIIPEFVQSKIKPKTISNHALAMLKNPKKFISNYSIVKKCLIFQKNVYKHIGHKLLN